MNHVMTICICLEMKPLQLELFSYLIPFFYSMIDMVIRLLVIFRARETPIKSVEDHGLSLSTIPVRILFDYSKVKKPFQCLL